jgi:hypothetical protein
MAKSLSTVEKVELALSIAAIVISITSPIVTYYWLDPTLQAFKLRARLQIAGTIHRTVEYKEPKRSNNKTNVRPNETRSLAELLSQFGTRVVHDVEYEVEISNIGQLPAKEAQIVAQFESAHEINLDSISFEPAILFEVTQKPGRIFITLSRPIAPQDTIKVRFRSPLPTQVSVSNEFGETSTIQTGTDWKNPSTIIINPQG